MLAFDPRLVPSHATNPSQTATLETTLSLAFLNPPLVRAGIEGRLPRGFGVRRLMDLPLIWADQWTALGLKAPIKT
jgi:hypothetical protein